MTDHAEFYGCTDCQQGCVFINWTHGPPACQCCGKPMCVIDMGNCRRVQYEVGPLYELTEIPPWPDPDEHWKETEKFIRLLEAGFDATKRHKWGPV